MAIQKLPGKKAGNKTPVRKKAARPNAPAGIPSASLEGRRIIKRQVKHAAKQPVKQPATQRTVEFHLREEFVELCNLLKLVGIADSGGRGKQMVAEGLVHVDEQPESRKTAKIRAGQHVDCDGVRITVLAAE